MEITLTLFQFIGTLILMVVIFLVYRYLEPELFYKISKPYRWTEGLGSGKISKELIKLEKKYNDKVRFYNFWFQTDRLNAQNIPGAFAELGVFQGETANLLHKMDPSRDLHLFDTFQGFDEKDLEVEADVEEKLSRVDFSETSLELVKSNINGNENVHFHPGFFPDSADALDENQFALVHLDADLYQPTKAALEFFYPNLSPGGVIIVHDYNHNWDGARSAVEEFAKSIPEVIIEIPDWQGSVMILKNKS